MGLQAAGHLGEVVRYAGITPSAIIVNSDTFPDHLLTKYAAEGNHPVLNDLTSNLSIKVLSHPLLAKEEVPVVAGDTLTRSLLRHDADVLAAILLSL